MILLLRPQPDLSVGMLQASRSPAREALRIIYTARVELLFDKYNQFF